MAGLSRPGATILQLVEVGQMSGSRDSFRVNLLHKFCVSYLNAKMTLTV